MESFTELCKKNNLKVTPQRILIYKELVESKDHPSTEVLYKKVKKIFSTISFDTVYRTLLTFSKIGIVDILTLPGEPKRFDGDKSRHYHFICKNCNNIIDIHDNSCNIEIPESISQKFDISDSKIIFVGICDKCIKNK